MVTDLNNLSTTLSAQTFQARLQQLNSDCATLNSYYEFLGSKVSLHINAALYCKQDLNTVLTLQS